MIHCSATPPTMDIGRKEIDAWHRSRGWKEIGYHFVIRRNGVLEQGRSINKAGVHCQGYNQESIALCYVGGVDENLKPKDTRTREQKACLQSLVKDLCRQFPSAWVCGHNEFASKACPSFYVASEFRSTEKNK